MCFCPKTEDRRSLSQNKTSSGKSLLAHRLVLVLGHLVVRARASLRQFHIGDELPEDVFPCHVLYLPTLVGLTYMARIRGQRRLVDGQHLQLENWLSHVLKPKYLRDYEIADYQFSTDQHRDEFLDSIHSRSEDVIRTLLRSFLINGGTLGIDERTRAGVRALPTAEVDELVKESEFIRRLVSPPFLPWDGITWVLDLLPHDPGKALETLDAYYTAHAQYFPDGRAHVLADAEAIIRRRYLHRENPRDALLALRPEEFEYLVAALYKRLGYHVLVTQRSRDGGVDVEARRADAGGRALVLVQCKRYTDVVRVQAVRELMGVVARRQANKGAIVATCGFTRAAREEAKTNQIIELIDFPDLNRLLNLHFGARWPNEMSYAIRSTQISMAKEIANTVNTKTNARLIRESAP
jgi:restriction system protein